MTFNNKWFQVHTTDFIYNPYQSPFTLNGLWHTTMETSHRLSRDSIINYTSKLPEAADTT